MEQAGELTLRRIRKKYPSKKKYIKGYAQWRKAVISRDCGICQMCFMEGKHVEAHHIIPQRDDKNNILEVDNGITLCEECHNATYRKEYEIALDMRWLGDVMI